MAKAKVYRIIRKRPVDLKVQRFILPLAIAVIAFIWVTAPTMNLINERTANKDLKLQLKKQLATNTGLRQDIKKLNTKSFIEVKARKDLGLVKPNEIQYYVLLKKAKVKAKKKAARTTFWQKALNYIEIVFAK